MKPDQEHWTCRAVRDEVHGGLPSFWIDGDRISTSGNFLGRSQPHVIPGNEKEEGETD